MKNKKIFFIGILIFAVFIGVSLILYKNIGLKINKDEIQEQSLKSDNKKENQQPKSIAEDFKVYDTNGNEVNLSDKFGKPLVINFWASWCPPCKMEMPHFDEVYADISNQVEFMMVDMVGGRETKEKGTAHIEKEGYKFPVYFDTDQNAAYKYGINSLPTTIFIDKDGYIAAQATGMIDKGTLIKGIEMISVVKENSPKTITGDRAKEIMDSLPKDDYIILDVRTDKEFKSGHIDGAVLIPDYQVQEKANDVIKDKDKTVFIYCRSGNRSVSAAKTIAQLGYTNVYDFGGIKDWKYTIVK